MYDMSMSIRFIYKYADKIKRKNHLPSQFQQRMHQQQQQQKRRMV